MDIEKHIAYWRDGAQEDFGAAEDLVRRGRYRHGLFFAHLAVEKMLKAHVTKATVGIPPKIHNLVRLGTLSALSLSQQQIDFLEDFNLYQLEGRYPENVKHLIQKNTTVTDMGRAKELIQWLNSRL